MKHVFWTPYANRRTPRAHAFEPTRVDENGKATGAQQQFKDDTNILNIMKKYAAAGIDPRRVPSIDAFQDFTGVTDYQEALMKVQAAEESFLALGSEIRNKFHNDPMKLIAFLADEKNNEEAISLGLRVRPRPSDSDVLEGAVSKALEKNDEKRAKKASDSSKKV